MSMAPLNRSQPIPSVSVTCQVRVAPAVVGHLGGEARQQLVLDADAELPLGATLARALEQALAVDVAVGLHVRRDAAFPASALGRREANRRAAASRLSGSRPYRTLSCPAERRRPAADVRADCALKVQQVAVDDAVAVHVGPGTV
jgi:hypothetical protein